MADEFEQVVQRIDPNSRLLNTQPLIGGISAQVNVLQIEKPDGTTEKMIVRRHGKVDFAQNPNIAADEFKLLSILKAEGLPTPAPIYVDTSCDIFPTPYLVVEFIEGATEFRPLDLDDYVRQLAANLAWIHRVPTQSLGFLPKKADHYAERVTHRPHRLDDSLEEGRIRDALEAAFPLQQKNETVLLHGDYWLGNTLWRGGQLVGIIDWEDSALGDPLTDVSNCRLEVLWALGMEAMEGFTTHYQAIMPHVDFSNLPYWDLYMALRPAFRISEWASDAAQEQHMREIHRLFREAAFETLAARKL